MILVFSSVNHDKIIKAESFSAQSPTKGKQMKNCPRIESVQNVNGVSFKIGDGVHWGYNGDSYPGTVVAVSASGRVVMVQDDNFVMDESDRGFKEGARKGTFSQPVEIYKDVPARQFKLFKNGQFREGSSRGNPLNQERVWARNPSF